MITSMRRMAAPAGGVISDAAYDLTPGSFGYTRIVVPVDGMVGA